MIEIKGKIMRIKQEINHAKTLFNQGIDLLLLRLQVLNLDLAEQAGQIFRIMIMVLAAAICSFIALISLLFALNRILSDEWAIFAFISIAVILLLIIGWLFYSIIQIWRAQNMNINQTLNDIRNDIACLRGQTVESAIIVEETNESK